MTFSVSTKARCCRKVRDCHSYPGNVGLIRISMEPTYRPPRPATSGDRKWTKKSNQRTPFGPRVFDFVIKKEKNRNESHSVYMHLSYPTGHIQH
jgi:hypothetical protein